MARLRYKKNAPKERYQFRRFGGGDYKMPTHPADFKACMTGIYDLFEKVADVCLDVSLSGCGISTEGSHLHLVPPPHWLSSRLYSGIFALMRLIMQPSS
jgi:hypothetical protein